MKKQFFVVLFTVFALFSYAEDPSSGAQSDFYGTWYLEMNKLSYTISAGQLVAHDDRDNTGFVVRINKWQPVTNHKDDSKNYPTGFRISGTIEQMEGNWWIGVGGSDTWEWYISVDKKSLITYEDDRKYVYVKQSGVQSEVPPGVQSDFHGTWYLEMNKLSYTISAGQLVAYDKRDNTGFVVRINKWQPVTNNHKIDSKNYPTGFRISGTVEEMEGSWWIGVGGSNTWEWYISVDKKSLISYGDDRKYVYVKQ
jgi:hypothetical protein